MFSTDKCVLLKLPLIWHCVILEETSCGGILLTQAFVMMFAFKINFTIGSLFFRKPIWE